MWFYLSGCQGPIKASLSWTEGRKFSGVQMGAGRDPSPSLSQPDSTWGNGLNLSTQNRIMRSKINFENTCPSSLPPSQDESWFSPSSSPSSTGRWEWGLRQFIPSQPTLLCTQLQLCRNFFFMLLFLNPLFPRHCCISAELGLDQWHAGHGGGFWELLTAATPVDPHYQNFARQTHYLCGGCTPSCSISLLSWTG